MNTKRNTIFLWMMAGAIVSLCGGLFGFTVNAQSQGQHQKVSSSSGEAETAQPKIICPMEWASPSSSSNAGEMPPTGAVNFDWSDHPAAHGYDLTVVTPNGSPVFYEVDGTSKDLFLENYDQVGTYQVIVTALDAGGSPLCSIAMTFDMPVVSGSGKEKANHGGGDDEPAGPSSVIPSNPVMPSPPPPAPTEVEIN